MSNYPVTILVDRPPARPACHGQLHRAALPRMHGPGSGRRSSTATPRRSAFVYLANGVHSLNYQITTPGKDYAVFPIAQAFGEAPPGHHAHQRPASPGSPRPPPQLHLGLADRRQARPVGSEHHLRGPEDGRGHREAHAIPLDGGRPHAGFPRLDRGRGPAARDAPLQRDLRVPVRRTERRDRGSAEGLAPQRQRPGRQPRGSAPTRAERWERRTKDAWNNISPPFVRRKFARGGPMRGSIRRSPPSPTPIANAPIATSPPPWRATISAPSMT